jgi:hypothetical protein
MIKLKNELAALALSDLEEVVGGGKIGDAAQKASEGSGLFKAARDIGQAVTQEPLMAVGGLLANIVRQH